MGVKLGNGKWAIKEDKLLAYNDNSGRFFNKEFDFSRGSSATYVAKDGLIKTAGLQETNLVNNGDFSELGSELITNGDFSDGETGWTKGGAASATQEVVNSALVMYSGSASDANNSLSRTNTPQGYNGKIYKLELTVSDMLVSPTGFIRLDSVYDASNIISFGTGTSTIYFTAYRDFTHIRFFAGSAEDGYTIDNVSVKQVDPNDYWTLGTGWSIEDGKAVFVSGGVTGGLTQNNVLIANKKYRISFYTDTILNLYLGSNTSNITTGTGSFNQELTVPSGSNGHLLFTFNPATPNGYIDNILVQEIQTDTPRIDFSDSVKGALLLEPSSTQLIQYSEQFSQSIWGTWQSTKTEVNNINPTGLSGYYQISHTGSSTDNPNTRLTNVSLNGAYTLSFFVKTNQSRYISLTIDDYNGDRAKVYFDTINKTFTTISNVGSPITNTSYNEFLNDWVRISLSVNLSNAVYNEVGVGSYNPSGSFPSASGEVISIWGAMLEAKSFATSYIPNYGVSGGVTRLADVCINSGSAQDFSEEGVLYAEIAALANDGTNKYISINNGGTEDYIFFRYRNNNDFTVKLRSGNTNKVNQTFTLSNNLDFIKIAFSYKENEFKIFVNGLQIGSTITTGATSASGTLNNIDFEKYDGADDFYGKIREVQVFTEALTDEQLQKLTTI